MRIMLTTAAIILSAAAILWFQNERIEKKTGRSEDDCSSDRFCSYDELAGEYEEGEDYEIVKSRSGDDRWLVSAIHGGGIEETTSSLTEAIAGSSYPFYAFKGRLTSNNYSNLHITSTRFDEPQALKMVADTKFHISIHGASGDKLQTMIGGLDEELKQIVKQHLENKGFTVIEAPENLDGDHPDNYVNQTKTGQGVQIEITRAQRKAFYKDGDISYQSRKDSSNETEEFKAYVEAIQAAMKDYD
ncbi:poly-gamma-glutamate hydrolase family protein [Halobacillus litoralis]|uniref:Replication protein n=1 Tax=Halobacillus litoralis TaxID=45668 RepID=A0A410MBP1_9BACI|nr:poly-gamma-glutamate hydrolase family protein [Halobacillus litoralis]QAS52098.1 hypothetical protein HLI_07605 [Halobacillus litoralis]